MHGGALWRSHVKCRHLGPAEPPGHGHSGPGHGHRLCSSLERWEASFLLACSLKTHSDSLRFGAGREPREVKGLVQSYSTNQSKSQHWVPSRVFSLTQHTASLPPHRDLQICWQNSLSQPAGPASLHQGKLGPWMGGSPWSSTCQGTGFRLLPVVEERGRRRGVRRRKERTNPKLAFGIMGSPG